MPTLERPLSEGEVSYFNEVTFSAGHAIKYYGNLDIEALEAAFHTLADRYPLLRARIENRSGKLIFSVPENHYPDFVATEGDWETLLREAKKLGDGGELASLLVIHNESTGYITLGMDHIIISGGAAFSYYSELFQIYTDIIEGRDIDLRKREWLPDPIDKFSPTVPSRALGSERSNKESLYLSKRDHGHPESISKKSNDNSFTNMEVHHAGKLRKICRAHNIGMGTFIGSIMATTLRDRNSTPGKMPMNFLVAIDHATGKRLFTDVTVSHLRHRISIDIDLHADAVLIAKKLGAKYEKARSENIFYDEYPAGENDIVLNSYGKVKLTQPSELELDFDLTRVVKYGNPDHNKPIYKKTEGEIEYSKVRPCATVSSYSFNNQLRVKCVANGEHRQSESLANEFMHRLLSIS